jgi:hypothetical protein
MSIQKRLSRLFEVCQKISDLQQLISIKTHSLNYANIGEMNERTLRQLEEKYVLELQRLANQDSDKEQQAINKYVELTKENNNEVTNKKTK